MKSDLDNHSQFAHYAKYNYFIKYPPNNQVVEYDLEKGKWNFLQDVTLPSVGIFMICILIDFQMNFIFQNYFENQLDVHYKCATSFTKNGTM